MPSEKNCANFFVLTQSLLNEKRICDHDLLFHVGHACVEGNMATERDVDELFEIKTALYTGNYQHCINECHKLRVTHFIYFCNSTETLNFLSERR